jgi:hypothetical protein
MNVVHPWLSAQYYIAANWYVCINIVSQRTFLDTICMALRDGSLTRIRTRMLDAPIYRTFPLLRDHVTL